MPVTKTAKRALRGSLRKKDVNSTLVANMEAKIRLAKKTKKEADVRKAISIVDKAAKKHFIHKNKASRLKSSLEKLSAKKPKSPNKKKH